MDTCNFHELLNNDIVFRFLNQNSEEYKCSSFVPSLLVKNGSFCRLSFSSMLYAWNAISKYFVLLLFLLTKELFFHTGRKLFLYHKPHSACNLSDSYDHDIFSEIWFFKVFWFVSYKEKIKLSKFFSFEMVSACIENCWLPLKVKPQTNTKSNLI